MKTTNLLFLTLTLTLALAVSAGAQDVPKVEIPVGFSMINVHPNLDPISSFNVFGGGGQIDFNFGNVFGIKADLMGYTQGSGLRNQLQQHGFVGQANGNLFTYMFGPQVKKHTGVFQPFGEALFGAAHTNAYATILTDEGRILSGSNSNNAFAMALGGGLDLAVSKHIAIRPVEVDYLLTRFGAQNYQATQNNFRYMGGFDFMFGGAPPVPVAASCSATPAAVWSGDPVTVSSTGANFNPKHTLTYAWTGTGGKLSAANAQGATVDTAGLAPGSYTATATITDPKEKKNNTATCSASFSIKQPQPPVVSCSATTTTIAIGATATVTMTASDPQGWPLTYAWTNTGGTMSGSGTSVTVTGTNADGGNTISVTGTATDARANLTATCNATVNVLAPPVTVNEVTEIGDCQFMDAKRPWRVDNTCKAILDDVALRVQREPNGKFVIVGFTDDQETTTVTQVGAQRAVNVKYYLVNGEGGSQIDATRLDVRTSGTVKEKGAKIYFVPSGVTFTQESVVVDETQVKGQARNAPAPKKHSKKKAAAPATAPAQ